MLIAAFALLILAAGSRASEGSAPKNPDIENGMTMRNEIVEFVIAEYEKGFVLGVLEVTHLVEKYIKSGDDFESAKELLLKNGFKVEDKTGLKKHMTETVDGPNGRKIVGAIQHTYRLAGYYKMKYPMNWTKPLYRFTIYDWRLQIFFGRSPESERIDEIFAAAKLRAF